jgi:uncharacterized protein YuzE
MDTSKKTATLFEDLKQGLDEAIEWARGERPVRGTYVSTPEDRSYISFYDPQKDELYIQVSQEKIVRTDEAIPGVSVDYDAQGKLIGVKLASASAQFAHFAFDREKTAA